MASLNTTELPFTVRRRLADGRLRSSCSFCTYTQTMPDKGLGRANLCAWESRHGANCPDREAHPGRDEGRVLGKDLT